MFLFLLAPLLAAPAAGAPHDYFVNSWAAIGLKDYARGTRITPANELLLAGGEKLMLRFGSAGTLLKQLRPKTLLDGYLPVVRLEGHEGDVAYEFLFWATPLPDVPDWKAAFDGPAGGENYLNWIRVRVTNRGKGPAAAGLAAERRPKKGKSRTLASRTWRLAGGEGASATLRVPFEPIAGEDSGSAFKDESPDLWLERTRRYWNGVLASGARIEVPERRATNCWKASLINQLIGLDHGELHAGEGFYDEFYIRDAAYQVMHLEESGLLETARAAMEPFLEAQRPDGRFESQKGQLDANGQAIWALWQYYLITRDADWLARAYPAMRRAALWTREARRRTAKDPAFPGLLPAALADGEYLWAGKNHIVGYDFWNLRGLLCVVKAARALRKDSDAKLFADTARAYRASIDAAWKRTGLPHFPPSWEKDGTHWGNTETLWPLPLFEKNDPRVAATVREVREHFGGGFLEGTIRWCPGRVDAIHPYMSSYTTLASLEMGDDEKVAEEFAWCLFHSSAAHSLPEGIYYRRRFAWGHTTPHLLGAANYAILLRHMLVHEEGDDLHLLDGVPDWWLAPGRRILVERAPTHFGLVTLEVQGEREGIDVRFVRPRRNPPARVVLHVPESRKPRAAPDSVEVAPRPDQKTAWSLKHVIAQYREGPPYARAIPHLVSLPLEDPAACGEMRPLDLTGAVNADPYTAPFGVKNPGRFLFTALQAGTHRAGGVPFRIVDARARGGRGLVVLQGRGGSAAFPREVSIEVGATGKRLFFLGNVHGWSPADRGRGEWGALAEYVIRYADGKEQVVPWIAGRTTDDWASAPEAADVIVGLQGDPWHLNVLGVELRPAEVKEIVFRDLGTDSAPLLAAVTLELAPSR